MKGSSGRTRRSGYSAPLLAVSLLALLAPAVAVVGTPAATVAATPQPPVAPVARVAAVRAGASGTRAVTLVTGTTSADAVTIPAGGSTELTLTASTGTLPAGRYAGRLTATSADGTVLLQTALGGYQEPRMHEVAVTVLDRNGEHSEAADGYNRAFFLDLATGEVVGDAADGQRLRLPEGRYLAFAAVRTPGAGTSPGSRSLLIHPQLTLGRDTPLRVDARAARRVHTTVDRPGADLTMGRVGVLISGLPGRRGFAMVDLPLTRYDTVYAAAMSDVANPQLEWFHREMLQEPELALAALIPQRFPVKAEWYGGVPRLVGSHRLPVAYGGAGTPAELAARDVRGKLVLLSLAPDEADQLAGRVRNVARAGGRAVLDVGAARVPFLDPSIPPPVPVGYAFGPSAVRLADLARQGTVTVAWRGLRASPYRYEVSFPALGRMPQQHSHTLHDADLAAIRTTYHADLADGEGCTGAGARTPGHLGQGAGGCARVPWPLTRTEYVTPGEWSFGMLNVAIPFEQLEGGWRSYRRGGRYGEDWNKAARGPAFPADVLDAEFGTWVHRDGDAVTAVAVPLLSDSQGHAGPPIGVDGPGFAERVSLALYRDGILLGDSDVLDFARFDLPADAGQYRLTAAVTRAATWWPLSTKVTASWTFRSGHTAAPTALPLLTVRADPPVDRYNRAPGHTVVRMPVSVERQDRAGPVALRRLAMQVSYDDGRTWRPATVATHSGHWTLTVQHPTSGNVSLRVQGTDTDGNTVDQTIIRAYALSQGGSG